MCSIDKARRLVQQYTTVQTVIIGSRMSFRLVPILVILNELEPRNRGLFCANWPKAVDFAANYVKLTEAIRSVRDKNVPERF